MALAMAAALLVAALPCTAAQLAALALGAAVGRWALPAAVAGAPSAAPLAYVSPLAGAWCLVAVVALFAGTAALAAMAPSALWGAVAACVRAGTLVFGGGHVVLPWLQAGLVQPGWMSPDAFLAGYGAAQAVPGPLFTVAAYLGAALQLGGSPWRGGLLLLAAIFLPALLVVAGALPFWDRLRGRHGVRRALAGVNAAVVGLLGAALWNPVGTGAIHTPADALLALGAFALLLHGRVPLVAVVLLCAGARLALG